MITKILYIGYEPKTIQYILENKNNHLIAVGKLDIINLRTINPINILYYLLYFFRQGKPGYFFIFEKAVYYMCSWTSIFTSGVFKRYDEYILNLYKNKIAVWNLNDGNYVDEIRNNIDLIIVNIWGLLDKEIFLAPKLGSVNIHPSKLPKNIGAVPTLWSLKNNEKESAVSYIFITDRGIDMGNIIKQEIFLISDHDNIIDIEKKVLGIIKDTINEVIDLVTKKEVKIFEQDLIRPTRTPKYEAYREINPNMEISRDILNKVIGYPYVIYGEYCYIMIGSKKIYIKNIRSQGDKILNKKLNLIIRGVDNVSLYAKLFIDVNILDSLFIIINK